LILYQFLSILVFNDDQPGLHCRLGRSGLAGGGSFEASILIIVREEHMMPDTREASQRNLAEIFNHVVAEFQGKVKIEATYPRWGEQLDASTLTPKLHFYLLGSPEPHYIQFSRVLFDDCANDSHIEDLAKAEDIIRRKLDSLLKNSHL
jgi:hypothetical protein